MKDLVTVKWCKYEGLDPSLAPGVQAFEAWTLKPFAAPGPLPRPVKPVLDKGQYRIYSLQQPLFAHIEANSNTAYAVAWAEGEEPRACLASAWAAQQWLDNVDRVRWYPVYGVLRHIRKPWLDLEGMWRSLKYSTSEGVRFDGVDMDRIVPVNYHVSGWPLYIPFESTPKIGRVYQVGVLGRVVGLRPVKKETSDTLLLVRHQRYEEFARGVGRKPTPLLLTGAGYKVVKRGMSQWHQYVENAALIHVRAGGAVRVYGGKVKDDMTFYG